jgi:hypothetical protein
VLDLYEGILGEFAERSASHVGSHRSQSQAWGFFGGEVAFSVTGRGEHRLGFNRQNSINHVAGTNAAVAKAAAERPARERAYDARVLEVCRTPTTLVGVMESAAVGRGLALQILRRLIDSGSVVSAPAASGRPGRPALVYSRVDR